MKKLLLAATLVSVALMFGLAVVPAGADPEANNWYVCKFVGTPGVDEVLQTGQNPIGVDENSIKAQTGKDTVSIGDEFPDAQGRSVVVAGPFAPPGEQPGPGVEICGVSHPTTTVEPPPTTTTTTTVEPPPTTTTTTTAEPPTSTTVTTTSSAPPPVTSTTVTSTTTTPVIVPPPPGATTTTTATTTAPPQPEPSEPPDNAPPDKEPPSNPPKPPPDELAFTGPMDMLPVGLLALALLVIGTGLLRMGRKAD